MLASFLWVMGSCHVRMGFRALPVWVDSSGGPYTAAFVECDDMMRTSSGGSDSS